MSGRDQALMKAMELVGTYLNNQSEDIREDTEVSSQERLLISLLEGMAYNPFPTWKPDPDDPFSKLESKSLQRFIELFDKRGKSLNRGSRQEVVQIFNGIFQAFKERGRRGEDSSFIDKVLS